MQSLKKLKELNKNSPWAPPAGCTQNGSTDWGTSLKLHSTEFIPLKHYFSGASFSTVDVPSGHQF